MIYKRTIISLSILLLINLAIAIVSLNIGRYQVSFNDLYLLIKSIFEKGIEVSGPVRITIINIRLPRILSAFLVGATLSLTGAAYQGMFRNPMVSPSLLGVSSGAGFGAALAILFALSSVWVQTFAFVFGTGAVMAAYMISLSVGKKHDKCLTLILSGMIVATVFSSLISLLKYVADPYDSLPSIVYWLMGGLSDIETGDLKYILLISVPGAILLSLLGSRIDILSFGDDEAKSMGINVNRLRFSVIIIATLMTASAVSISGIIGWVGLLVPHIARMIVGPRNSILLPAAFLIGGAFLMLDDTFSRSISSMEIPIGITTSLIGAPFFIFILMRTNNR